MSLPLCGGMSGLRDFHASGLTALVENDAHDRGTTLRTSGGIEAVAERGEESEAQWTTLSRLFFPVQPPIPLRSCVSSALL